MKSKNIVMQVSEETAGVMEEIAEQLLEESTSNQEKLMDKLATVLDAIEIFRKDIDEQTLQSNKKVDRLIELMADVMDKLNVDDNHEKLVSVLGKLSDIEKEILQAKADISNISDTVHNYNELIEGLRSSVKGLQENSENIFHVSGENAKKIDEFGKQTDENSKLMFEKVGDILTCLDTLSHSVQTISEKQNELCEKQAELDKDVKYLKLPFLKRLFMKGGK